jgi:hypothetical protein
MDQTTTPAEPTIIPASNNPGPGLLFTKIPSVASFAVGLLLFFVPFLDIKCNNMVLQKVSGIQLATGFKVKGPGTDNSLFGNLEKMDNDGSNTKVKSEKKSPNTLALVALGLGVAGLLFAIGNLKKASMVAAAFTVVALIATMIDVKGQLKTELSSSRSAGADAFGSGNNFGNDVLVSIDFTAGFYLTVLVFAAAAFFGYKWIRGR